MKKILFIVAIFCLCSTRSHAQLAHTQWTGKTGQMNILWSFMSDTTTAVMLPDSVSIGAMNFYVKDNVVKFRKIEGMLPCDTTSIGSYSFIIKDNKLSFTLISDDCDARSHSIDGMSFDKVTSH